MPWDEIVRELGGVDPNTPPERLASRCFDAALVDALMSGGDGKGGDDGKGDGKGDEPADEPFEPGDDSDVYADDSVGFGVDRDARVVTYLRGPAEAAEAEWTLGAAMALAYPAVARAAGLDAGGDLGCAIDHLRFARPGGSRVAGVQQGSRGVRVGRARRGRAAGRVRGPGVAAGGARRGRRMSRGAGAAAAAAAAAALLGLPRRRRRRISVARGAGRRGQGPFGHRGGAGGFSIGAG